MSLKPQPPRSIPSEVAAWGEKHLSADSPYRYVGDTLFSLWKDEDFADQYHPEGKPALSPAFLALVTIFQRYEHLGDRAAVHAVTTRLDWKYALHLPLDDDGFDASVLSEFRTRLLKHQAEARIFDMVLAQLKERGFFKTRGTQRTDSTHVLAVVRSLNRLETVGETMRATLNALAVVAPDWLSPYIQDGWVERYGARYDEGRLPESQAKRQALAQQIGQDGYFLLDALYAADTPLWLREVPSVDILRRVWVQQYYRDADEIRWRDPDDLPPATVAINSPYDPEARYSSKHSIKWVGYRVHYTETCDEGMPRVITNVELTPAPLPDTEMTTTIHQHLADSDRLPEAHLVDAGYVDADHLVESQRDHQIDLVGPIPVASSWQMKEGKGFDAGSFSYDWDAKVATCPQGKRSRYWHELLDSHGNPMIHINFDARDCRSCAVHEQCFRNKKGYRVLGIRRQEAFEAIQTARQRQQTDDFKKQYAQRAGMEGTLSRAVRVCGLRRSHYIGEAKTHLQEWCIAAGLNIARVAEHLAGAQPVPRRISAFTRLITPQIGTAA